MGAQTQATRLFVGVITNMPNVWFISDTHFGHANIIKYCARPFSNVEEMNQAMITRWNTVVAPEDTVFHLGDFALTPKFRQTELLAQLYGTKHLILGNHDGSRTRMLDVGFATVARVGEYRGFYLGHNPISIPQGISALCGHVHEKWFVRPNGCYHHIFNVGVDQHAFTPVSLDTILNKAFPDIPVVSSTDRELDNPGAGCYGSSRVWKERTENA